MSDQRTALVLGGGGITGIAWEIGLLAGLAEAGTDLTGADLVVGTSAGSVVGAQVASGVGDRGDVRAPAGAGDGGEGRPAQPGDRRPVRLGDAAQPRQGRRVPPPGRCARPRRGEGRGRRRRSRSGSTSSARGWSAPSGRSGTWSSPPSTRRPASSGPSTATSGVPAAAGGRGQLRGARRLPAGHHRRPPLRRRRHAVGGNADLAHGYDRLVVLAPIPRGVGPMASVDAQVTGMVSRVAVVSPDKASRTAIGKNVLDPAARAPSARPAAPRRRTVAERIAEVWTG